MRRFFHIYLLRFFLILLFTLFVIYSEKNYGVQTIAKAEVLTLEEERHLSELIFRDLHHRMDSIVEVSAHRYGFNGNVLIAVHDQVVYQSCAGYADFHQRKRLTLETPFQLASVSKQFTAMAILLLEQEGKLSLDDPLQRFIPELPYEGVTIRHLLHHTSGVPNYMWYVENNWHSDSFLPSNEDMIRILAQSGSQLNYTPGRRFVYSNTGYTLLASVVERISGQSFGQFMRDHFFRPLGMVNASVYTPKRRATDPDYIAGYRRSWRRYGPFELTLHDGIVGDKGVYASVGDLFLWDQALNNGTLISYDLIRQAFTAGHLVSTREIPYGFGFRLSYDGESKTVYHHGKWSGFRTAFVKYLPDHTTIVILSNNSFNGLSQLADAFRQTLGTSSEYIYTRDLVEAVLSEGLEKALSDCGKGWQERMKTAVKPAILIEIAEYLDHTGKQNKSKRIMQLYQRLSS